MGMVGERSFAVADDAVLGDDESTDFPVVGADSTGAGSTGVGAIGAGSIGAGSIGVDSPDVGSTAAGSTGGRSTGAGSNGAGSTGIGSATLPLIGPVCCGASDRSSCDPATIAVVMEIVFGTKRSGAGEGVNSTTPNSAR